jgi:hypothetical protein
MVEGLYRTCEYPPCDQIVAAGGRRRLHADPDAIRVSLCAGHAAMIDRSDRAEDPDFWRWADAMLQAPGSG